MATQLEIELVLGHQTPNVALRCRLLRLQFFFLILIKFNLSCFESIRFVLRLAIKLVNQFNFNELNPFSAKLQSELVGRHFVANFCAGFWNWFCQNGDPIGN